LLNSFPPPLAELIARFLEILPAQSPLYLVGGAVRDILLGKAVHDIDLALHGNVLKIARRFADAVGGAYYPLDVERETGRIVIMPEGKPRLVIDLASLRGAGIEEDLANRDFSLNAMAINLHHPEALIDPLHGAADLHARQLRACSDHAFLDDPVRVLRAVRLAFSHKLTITSETRNLLRQAVIRLDQVSIERLRDELFRILSGSHVSQAVRTLDLFGALSFILPELEDLKNLTQSPPHLYNAWEHTLAVVDRLQIVLAVLGLVHDPDLAANLSTGLVAVRLGRFRVQINEHIFASLTPDRTIYSLIMMAALYHDVGKPFRQSLDEDGRIRFFDHDRIGAEMTAERARLLRLSTDEIQRLSLIVRHHMRPMLLAQAQVHPSRRAIYRFFRDSGQAGVDVCLLSLADFLGTYGTELPQNAWVHHLDIVRELLEAWWERSESVVYPPRLLDGHQLIQRYGLEPGPKVGRLLEELQEAQASGEVQTLSEAFLFVEKIINGE